VNVTNLLKEKQGQ